MNWLHQAHATTQAYLTEPDEKAAGSVWLPGPEVCRQLGGRVGQILPDSARISLCLQKETESGVVWLNLANFLQTSGPGNQIEPAFFVWLHLA